jgi:predicted DNA-binding transcriptional regulator YafY
VARSERLLNLLQALRRARTAVTGLVLARELGVSIRTLYRDIASLQSLGAIVDGEPGVGYVLRGGLLLPPLMFTEEEIEALVLGSRWVEKRADPRLASAAGDVLTKIAAVLPRDLRQDLEASTLLVGPRKPAPKEAIDAAVLRRAIRSECKLRMTYTDAKGCHSRRVVWPFAMGYFEEARVLVAWCETRKEFRHFRTDRILQLAELGQRYPRRRHVLLREWRSVMGAADQATARN